MQKQGGFAKKYTILGHFVSATITTERSQKPLITASACAHSGKSFANFYSVARYIRRELGFITTKKQNMLTNWNSSYENHPNQLKCHLKYLNAN